MTRALAVVAAVALALAMSCRIPDEHLRVGDGGGASDDAGMDAMGDGPPPACNLAGPWGHLNPVEGLVPMRSVARFSPDETTAYFALGSDGTATTEPDTLYVATKPVMGTFGLPTKLTGVNGSDGESTPAISSNGTLLYYVWGEPPVHMTGSDRDLYVATRSGSAAQFGSGTKLGGGINAVGAEDDYVSVAANGDLWFSSQRGSDPTLSIYMAPSVGNGQFGTVQRADALNATTVGDYYPTVAPDQLTIYFLRSNLVFVATRSSPTDDFGNVTTLDDLDNADCMDTVDVDCRPAWVSPDGCRFYVGTGSSGGTITMYYSSKPAN
ncbi:MAG TPA: hypothetical protein VGG74_25420 [Kofleriaceae bacterium]